MSPDQPEKRPPLIVRGAVRVGAALGRWQRQRAAERDDAFVGKWKAAWAEGCDAHASGVAQDQNPYKRAPRREAWTAGWLWAEGHRKEAVAVTADPTKKSARPERGR